MNLFILYLIQFIKVCILFTLRVTENVCYPTGTCTCLVLKVLGDAILISSPQNDSYITHMALIVALV